jgi:hypothetical protein
MGGGLPERGGGAPVAHGGEGGDESERGERKHTRKPSTSLNHPVEINPCCC